MKIDPNDYVVLQGPKVDGKPQRTFAVRPSHVEPYSAAIAAMDTLYFIGESCGHGATVEYCPHTGWSVWAREDMCTAYVLTEGHYTMIDALGAAWEAYQDIHGSEKP